MWVLKYNCLAWNLQIKLTLEKETKKCSHSFFLSIFIALVAFLTTIIHKKQKLNPSQNKDTEVLPQTLFFKIHLSLQPSVVDLWYFKPEAFLDQIF